MIRTHARRGLLAALLGLTLSGCAREVSVGGDLALLFIPTPLLLVGCLIGGCDRTPDEDEYEEQTPAR